MGRGVNAPWWRRWEMIGSFPFPPRLYLLGLTMDAWWVSATLRSNKWDAIELLPAMTCIHSRMRNNADCTCRGVITRQPWPPLTSLDTYCIPPLAWSQPGGSWTSNVPYHLLGFQLLGRTVARSYTCLHIRRYSCSYRRLSIQLSIHKVACPTARPHDCPSGCPLSSSNYFAAK